LRNEAADAMDLVMPMSNSYSAMQDARISSNQRIGSIQENAFEMAGGEKEAYKALLKQFMATAPVLRLDVVSSASLPKGQAITINPLGLFGNFQSEREKDCPGSGLDGFTYFGSMAFVNDEPIDGGPRHEDMKQVIVNDFVIPSRNPEASEQHKGRHF